MRNEIQVFTNEKFGRVRTTIIDGKPWFVSKDVAVALGYSNPQKAVRDHVDDDDRTVNDSFTVNGTPVTLINESGIYSLVLSSKLPTAKQFKRWITHDVIPAIRQHGAYFTDATLLRLLSDPTQAHMLVMEYVQEALENERLTAELQAALPKAMYYDTKFRLSLILSLRESCWGVPSPNPAYAAYAA